jgi:hypothetical protein
MNQYSIRHTRGHLKELLSKLPFEITRYGVVVAKVVGKSTTNDVHMTSGVKTNKNDEFTPSNQAFQSYVNHASEFHPVPKSGVISKKGCK